MTSRLQKPSASWNSGVEYVSSLSHVPTVSASYNPPGPKIHSATLVSLDRFPPNVFASQSPPVFESSVKRLRLQISSAGITNHCVSPTTWTSA